MPFVKKTWPVSLRVRVMLAYVAGTALTIGLIALVASFVTAWHGDLLSAGDVADAAEGMAEDLRFDSAGRPVGFDISDFDLDWVFSSMKHETAYRVLDDAGNVALSSPAGDAFWPASGPARELRRVSFTFEQGGIAMHGATEVVKREGRVWYVQFAASTRFLQLMYRAFALPFTGVGITVFSVLLLFVFGGCVYVMLRYTLRPLQQISDSAAAISPRALHARLQTDRVPSEIAPLVDSFNRVLERVELGFRLQQEFLATAAHELKTPLALIRAQVELGEPSPQRNELLRDVEHMTRQVQQLLHLAEASEANNYQYAMVDINAAAHEAADYLQRMARAADVRLELPMAGAQVLWRADRGALFTLLKNLLENAIQHSPPGSAVSLEVDGTSLAVRDHGAGVDAAQLPKIFARFWRGAHRRDEGAGLGLSICQEIAIAHGWTISARSASPGLRVQLTSAGGADCTGTPAA